MKLYKYFKTFIYIYLK